MSKLQTKVDSLETVKDVQDKIISAKDSQITFLQGEVSTIITWGSIAVAIIIALATVAYSYIKSLEEKAKDKIEEAENTLQTATQQLAQIEIARQETETNLTESDKKIEQLNSLIDESNNIATFAQEKLDTLETKQQELNDLAATIMTNQKYDMSFRQVGIALDLSKDAIDSIYEQIKSPMSLKAPTEHLKKLAELNEEYNYIAPKYKEIIFDFNTDVISGKKYDPEYVIKGLEYLAPKCSDLRYECEKLKRRFNKYE
ncbi:hypothetical protein [Bacillus thuringiensis]|uniref:hypothetical protein n=1 Tax=Bacillus thuringiensis TaxID=1428 RepID=UPI001CFC1BD5|nr:hypothetical protein [Bacillus thuringiensis]